MKIKTLLATIAIGSGVALTARADLFDNFDSYNTGSLNGQGGWTGLTGELNVTSADSVSAPNSVVWGSSAASRIYHEVSAGGTGIMASQIDFSFDFNDVGATRDYNCIYGWSGHAWGSGLTSVLAFGDYNTTQGFYMGRYSAITGATYSDGADATGQSGGWFALAAPKSDGWHHFEVVGSPDGADKAKLQFFIDSNLVGTVGNLGDYELNYACIGGALSVGITGGNTDNYSVSMVPEPSSIALSILGGLSLALGAISRRKS